MAKGSGCGGCGGGGCAGMTKSSGGGCGGSCKGMAKSSGCGGCGGGCGGGVAFLNACGDARAVGPAMVSYEVTTVGA